MTPSAITAARDVERIASFFIENSPSCFLLSRSIIPHFGKEFNSFREKSFHFSLRFPEFPPRSRKSGAPVMPEHDHTASAAKPTALFPRPVSICRGTKIIGMFLPRWLFRARLTLSAVFFRHFSRPPAAPRLLPADFRSLPLPRLRATGPGASAAPACLCLPAAPCAAHLPISALACTFFLHLLSSFFRRPSFLTFARLFFSWHVLSCAFLRCLLTLTIHRPFPSRDLPPFPPAFSVCDFPRLSPALAPLFLLRFPAPFACACPAFPFAISPRFPPAISTLLVNTFPAFSA